MANIVQHDNHKSIRDASAWAIAHDKKKPSLRTLAKWDWDGYSRTPDGCKVEPDGYCVHGFPSWLLICGLV
jgi:hypothetical protein